MFAPSIDTTLNHLTDGYASLLSLDGFSATVNNLVVVSLNPDPAWLPAVRDELATLRADADSWMNDRATVWAPVLLNFYSYGAAFQGFVSEAAIMQPTKDQWLLMLSSILLPSLNQCLASASASVKAIEDARAAFSAILPAMERSIQQGWVALGNQEQDMLNLAEEIGTLHAIAQSYSAKLTTDIISGGESYVQSTMSLTYSAVAAGTAATIPILGIATAVFTVGKSFYDIIHDDQELIDTMQRIAGLQQRLTADGVRLALTKATLQVLYRLEAMYLASQDALPALVDLWQMEQSKVQDAINALSAGADPNLLLDLVMLKPAQANWLEITKFVSKLQKIDVHVGAPVVLDIAKGVIEQQAFHI